MHLISIDYDALYKNTLFFRKFVGDKQLFAVVKNDAYGHGLVRVAESICSLVDGLAVGSVAEAEQILFLQKDVLVLLPQNQRGTEQAIKDGLILTVDSFDTLYRVDAAAKKLGKAARVHVKIDSGMSRLGFCKQHLPLLLKYLQNAPVNVEGIFSHFYGDTAIDCDGQLDYFNSCLSVLKQTYPHAVCHIANTSATLLSDKYHLDGVRIGLGLYGYGHDALVPVKEVSADVVAVRKVEKSSAVGYGAKYRPQTDTRVAVLNLGYAQGLPRILVGKKIKIDERLFPIAAICMGMTLVDVGDADVRVGQVATLLGDGVNLSDGNVIVYELLCNLK